MNLGFEIQHREAGMRRWRVMQNHVLGARVVWSQHFTRRAAERAIARQTWKTVDA